MKRFINIGNQLSLDDEEKNFSFFCTVIDLFETFNGFQVWDTKAEFIKDYFKEKRKNKSELERYLNLIPEDWL